MAVGAVVDGAAVGAGVEGVAVDSNTYTAPLAVALNRVPALASPWPIRTVLPRAGLALPVWTQRLPWPQKYITYRIIPRQS